MKNWPDCPYPVFLGSNTIKCNAENVTTIYSGEDKDWSSSYRKILAQIPTEYIFVTLEDFFISSTVSTKRIQNLFDFIEREKAKHIHFSDLPRPDQWLNSDFGIYDQKMPYRVNVAGFWDKKYLINLLLDGESPWNFEIMGSYRSSYDDGFYCANPRAFEWVNTVEKGHWMRDAMDFCKKNNIAIDASRPMLSKQQEWINQLQKIYFNSIIKVNWKFRLTIMNYLRKLLVSY